MTHFKLCNVFRASVCPDGRSSTLTHKIIQNSVRQLDWLVRSLRVTLLQCLQAKHRLNFTRSMSGSISQNQKDHETPNKQLRFWVTGLWQVLRKPPRIIQRCHWWAWAGTDSPKETSRRRLWNRTKQCHLVREKQGKILARTARQQLILNLNLC